MFLQTLLMLCGINTAKLPRRISGKGLTLRGYRFTDLAQLYGLLRSDVLLPANGVVYKEMPAFGLFCFWILTTFPLAYVIEAMVDGGSRTVGFVGFSGLTLGRTLWVSVAIFHPEDRRQGYGKQALSLILAALARHRVVSKVYADVLRTNTPSLRFFAQLGFVSERECADRIRLVKMIGPPLPKGLRDHRRTEITRWSGLAQPRPVSKHRKAFLQKEAKSPRQEARPDCIFRFSGNSRSRTAPPVLSPRQGLA